MGSVYIECGKYNQAKDHLLKCKQIYEKYFGKKNPGYLTCLNDLILVLLKLGSYSEAFDLLKACLNLIKNFLGDRHPLYLKTLNTMGIALSETKRFEDSLQCHLHL